MAFLNRKSAAWISFVCAAAGLAGCAFLRSIGGDGALAFSHARHVGGEKLDCANCHADALAADEPGMPAKDTCTVCHADIDAEKPPERHIQGLFHGDDFAAVHASALAGEVVFSHKLHASGQACDACHLGIESNTRVSSLRPVRMDACTACHQSKKAPGECATCHKEITEKWQPASHHSNWTRMHGLVAREHSEATADKCYLCHTESTCSTCHKSQAPLNHTNYWRERGHGVTAMVDRESCAACHEPASCERCHADVKPRNHVGNWGAPRDNHCLVCHQPLGQEGCVACHANANSHQLAAPKPSDHYPGMDCRACHGLSQALPHVDNGDDCNSCHH
jgi:c(7)-type cytochrome triheme protein